jgi:hypothetical protein
MHINYNDNNDIDSIDVEPYGDERKEIEKAAKRQFTHKSNQTALVRATLVAADVVNLNNAYFHASKYEKLAENIEVTRSTFMKNGLEYVNVKINNGN